MTANRTNPTHGDFPLTLTDRAARALGAPTRAVALRVAVVPGGCSGLRYVVTPASAENVVDGDLVLDRHGVTVLVGPADVDYLRGAVIDHGEAGFAVDNPNARGVCACGASFAPREQ